MTLIVPNEEKLNICERKIVVAIVGPENITENEFRLLMNYEMLGEENIIRAIKVEITRGHGHIHRREKNYN